MNNGKHSQEYLKRWCEQEGDKRLVAGANIARRDTHANFPDAASISGAAAYLLAGRALG